MVFCMNGTLRLLFKDILGRGHRLIRQNGRQDAQTFDDVVPEHRDIDHIDPQGDRTHQQAAQERAGDGPHATQQAGAAQHNGGNDSKLQAFAGQGLGGTGPSHCQNRRDAAQEPSDGIGQKYKPLGVNARSKGRSGVPAHCIQLNPEGQLFDAPQADDDKRDQENHRSGDYDILPQ